MRTHDQLKQIAIDMHAGRIFTDSHLPPEGLTEALRMIFLPLLFMDQAQLDALKAVNPRLFFEYYDEALPRGINGLPMFFSMQVLTDEELPIVLAVLARLEAAEAAIVMPAPGEEGARDASAI